MKTTHIALTLSALAAGGMMISASRIQASQASVIKPDQLKMIQGGGFSQCANPTCPNCGTCVRVDGGWVFYLNNLINDCSIGSDSCNRVESPPGTFATVPCYGRPEGNSTCTDPLGDQVVTSNQPYCNQGGGG